MPRPDVQQAPIDAVLSPTWEATPWVPEERNVEEPKRAGEPPIRLSDEHVIDLQESGAIRRVA